MLQKALTTITTTWLEGLRGFGRCLELANSFEKFPLCHCELVLDHLALVLELSRGGNQESHRRSTQIFWKMDMTRYD